MKSNEIIKQKLASRWSQRSPKSIANQFSRPLFGTSGEWDLPQGVTPKRDLLYLAVGIPDANSVPKLELEHGFHQVFSRKDDLALRYGFGKGPEKMRQWLADYRNESEHTDVNPDWFQLTNGSSGAIDLVLRSVINPGDIIIAENPTYMGTLHNFKGVGADVRYVSMDEQGLLTSELEQLLSQLKKEGETVKLIYTISAFHNPSGVTLSEERRIELLDIAYRFDVMILDDEAYRELWYDKPPPPSLSALSDGNGVITVGSFSKTVATGIRIGWIHSKPELLALFARMRFAMGQNQLGLRAFGEFLSAGSYQPHLKHIRQVYKNKRDVIHSVLTREVGDYLDWQIPEGGFYIWAKLCRGMEVEPLWRTAVEEGIAINPGSGFTPVGMKGDLRIRIAYPWTNIEDFEEAARRLGIACRRVVAGDSA